jgi:hypothetical protein
MQLSARRTDAVLGLVASSMLVYDCCFVVLVLLFADHVQIMLP